MSNYYPIHVRVFLFLYLFLLFVVLLPLSTLSQPQECYLLMAGKEATVDGKVFLAHNNDLTGSEASMLVRIPGDQAPEELPGSNWPEDSGYEMLVLQIYRGFAEGDAAAINEHGVAIAGGLALGQDRNRKARVADPLIETGLGGGVRYLALQHARTARQCIQLIGELYNHYGIKYPSGVGVADTNEIWYMEAGGGRCWAAVRVPDSCYFIAANSYRIGKIDFTDTLNYMTSPGLKNFCQKMRLWEERDGDFHFGNIFGNGRKEKNGNNLYNTRRVWRGIDLLNPELNTPADTKFFPMFLQPANPIDLQTCFTILRDHYNGTPYDPLLPVNSDHPERAIASWNCVHTDVITLMPGEPVAYGAVIWTGLSTPFAAIYVPVYFGTSSIPTGYDIAPSIYDSNSAFRRYKTLSDQIKSGEINSIKDWTIQRENLEQEEIKRQLFILKKARKLQKKIPGQLGDYLKVVSEGFAAKATALVRETMK